MKSKVPSDEYYHYGDNVTIDTTYNNKSAYKEEKWEEVATLSTSSSHNYQDILYNGTIYIALDVSTKSYMYSTDLINWTEGTFSDNWKYSIGGCYGNGKFVVLGYRSDSKYTGICAYSSDGINWTEVTLLPSQTGYISYYNINFINNEFIITFQSSDKDYCKILYSTNGINWSLRQLISIDTYIYKVLFAGKYFYCIINDYNTFYYSIDGITWTAINHNLNGKIQEIAYNNNNVYIAVLNSVSTDSVSSSAEAPYYFYSTDGLNWVRKDVSSYINSGKILYNNEIFMIVDYSTSRYSTDGINWVIFRPGYSWLGSLRYYNNHFMIFALNNVLTQFNIIYYQLSGWNKSDFNITTDTSITASWNTVSSGDGLNFID